MEMLILTDRNIDNIRKTIEMRYEEVLNNSYRIIKKKRRLLCMS